MTKALAVPLGEIAAIRIGSVDPAKFPDEVFDLYSIPAFDTGQPEVIAGRDIGSTKQIVQPGDTLLSRIVPHIRRAWIVGQDNGRRMIASGEWIVFRSERVHPGYLRYVLVGDPFHSQFMQTVAGVGGSLLRARPTQVAKITIPLPPLSEQRRIAAILDKADALRRKRQQALQLTEQFLRSTFLDMFGDPVTNPKGWPISKFGRVCDSRLGKMLDAKQQTGQHCRPYLRNLNVQWGKLDLTTVFEMDFDDSDREEFRLEPGDVMICEGGAGVGQTAIWRGELAECYFQKSLHRVRPNPELALPEYVAYLIWMLMKGSAMLRSLSSATIPHLTGVRLKELDIPVPPIALQRAFAGEMEAIERIRARGNDLAERKEDLFNSLVQRAFRGEL